MVYFLRTVSFTWNQQAAPDLTAAEAEGILAAGLAWCRCSMWPRGLDAHGRAGDGVWGPGSGACGGGRVSGGVNVWWDLEGVAAGVTAEAVIEYCGAWFSAIKTAGFVPGLYVGANCVLDAQELQALPFAHF